MNVILEKWRQAVSVLIFLFFSLYNMILFLVCLFIYELISEGNRTS